MYLAPRGGFHGRFSCSGETRRFVASGPDNELVGRSFCRCSSLLVRAGFTWIPDPCPTLASGLGRPFSHRTNSVGAGLFRWWLFVSSHNIPCFGLHWLVNLVFRYIIHSFWSGLALRSRPAFWTGEVASFLDTGAGYWCGSPAGEFVCLMTSNLDVLDQYVFCLQGTASKILDISLGSREFCGGGGCGWGIPGPPGLEAMGLRRPSMDPVGRPWTILDCHTM